MNGATKINKSALHDQPAVFFWGSLAVFQTCQVSRISRETDAFLH